MRLAQLGSPVHTTRLNYIMPMSYKGTLLPGADVLHAG